MRIKELNKQLQKLINENQLDDIMDEEGATARDYVQARFEHIEDSLSRLINQFPEIKDTYEYEDINNQIKSLKLDLNIQ